MADRASVFSVIKSRAVVFCYLLRGRYFWKASSLDISCASSGSRRHLGVRFPPLITNLIRESRISARSVFAVYCRVLQNSHNCLINTFSQPSPTTHIAGKG